MMPTDIAARSYVGTQIRPANSGKVVPATVVTMMSLPSAVRVAAVDGQRHPGDHGGIVTQQEGDRAGDVVHGGPPVQGHLRQERLTDLWTSPVELGHLAHHDGRVHAVDPDVVLAQLQGAHPGDVVERGLGRAVGDVPVERHQAGLAGDVDDGTATSRGDHGPACVLDHQQAAPGIDAHHLVEDVDVGLLGGSDLTAPATAVHHTPQLETLHRLPDAVLRGEVEGQGPRAGRGRHLFQLLHGPAPGNHVGSITDQAVHGGTADIARGARHEDCAPCEVGHDVASFLQVYASPAVDSTVPAGSSRRHPAKMWLRS